MHKENNAVKIPEVYSGEKEEDLKVFENDLKMDDIQELNIDINTNENEEVDV